MKLHLTTSENNNLITAYSESYIEINRQRFNQNLVVAPDNIITSWTDSAFADLRDEHFSVILALQPEVVLLGTGIKHLFLHPKHYQSLTEKGIALECMATAAACRTYNILMSEGRSVAAALLVQQ